MTDPFAAPATSTGIDYKEINGALLLIDVVGVEKDVPTSLGTKDAVRADVVVIDGDQAGESFEDALIFPKVLQSQLRSRAGQKVLGRLGQGVAKPGQSAPWLLAEATETDKATARAHLAGSSVNTATTPATDGVPF